MSAPVLTRSPARMAPRRWLQLAAAAALWIFSYQVNLAWWDWIVYADFVTDPDQYDLSVSQ